MNDMQDLILIGGGAIILLVILHGCWLAWRRSREPVIVKIDNDLIPEDDEDTDLFRAELPSGGARIVGPEQTRMNFDPKADRDPAQTPPSDSSPAQGANAADRAPASSAASPSADSAAASRRIEPIITAREPQAGTAPQEAAASAEAEPAAASEPDLPAARELAGEKPGGEPSKGEPPAHAPAKDSDLLVLRLTAPGQKTFVGEPLVEALRRRGLRYGEMDIFHRRDPQSQTVWFSVANLVEPGHFNLAKISEFVTPGLIFFLKLPGPEDPQAALKDMIEIASSLASELGGELRDENMNLWSGQSQAQYRRRAAAFSAGRPA